MRVKMLVDLTGHWAGADGVHHEWPPHGTEVEVPDDMGADVVRTGYAVEVVPRAPRHVKAVAADPIKPVIDKA